MLQNNKRIWYLDYLMIIVGTALMAVAVNSVFDLCGMVTGGFSGIAHSGEGMDRRCGSG